MSDACSWDGVSWSIDRLVDDTSANARHELARRLRAAEREVERLREELGAAQGLSGSAIYQSGRVSKAATKLVQRVRELADFYPDLDDAPDGAALAWDLVGIAIAELGKTSHLEATDA